jgi:hypothetical protein
MRSEVLDYVLAYGYGLNDFACDYGLESFNP